jgi:hypothetical protein
VVRRQGGSLFVGPVLHAASDPQGLERVQDREVPIEPGAAATASVFAMNLAVLAERGEVPARPDLAAALAAIAGGAAARPVHWRFRQIAWRRTG